MTVRDLIDHLSTLPQDYQVIYKLYSDYEAMTVEDIKVQHATDKLTYFSAVCHHNMPGRYRLYTVGIGAEEFLPNVVIFPG